MYIPGSFLETDLSKLHAFIEQYSFGTLVTTQDGTPFATHIPLLLDRSAGPCGRLIGHVARANPQWRTGDGQNALVIFQGPHSYISPAWYEAKNVVPTWNYVAVHAYGRLRVLDDPTRASEIVRRTVEQYESPRSAPWSLDSVDPTFLDGMVEAITAFEIDLERIEGKWKLSQNHPVERREKVIQALREAGRSDEQQVADLMTKMLPSP
jgi:transcriptional regulator